MQKEIIAELQDYTDYDKLIKEERFNARFVKRPKRAVTTPLLRTISVIGDILSCERKKEYSDIVKVLQGNVSYTTCHTRFVIYN